MAKDDPNKDIAAMRFEAAMAALEQIVEQLENGRVDLEESIALYERGAALRAHCDKKLKSAVQRVEQIVGEGTAVTDASGLESG
jgi:exodeoxyribonuclease VII small subunit